MKGVWPFSESNIIRQWLVDTGVRVNRHFIIFSGWLVHCSRSYCWLPSCWDVIVSDYYHFLSHKPPPTHLNLPPLFYPQIIFRDEVSKEIFDVQIIFDEGTKRTRFFSFSVSALKLNLIKVWQTYQSAWRVKHLLVQSVIIRVEHCSHPRSGSRSWSSEILAGSLW